MECGLSKNVQTHNDGCIFAHFGDMGKEYEIAYKRINGSENEVTYRFNTGILKIISPRCYIFTQVNQKDLKTGNELLSCIR